MMKISIIGAGFSGLAVAWHLLSTIKKLDLTIIDQGELGNGASGISAGLMHPFTGFTAKLNHEGIEGYLSTLELLKIASAENKEIIYRESGLIRFPVNDKQKKDFIECAKIHKEAVWLTSKECLKLTSNYIQKEGLFLTNAITVNPKEYLQGLLLACQKIGVITIKEKVTNLSDLYHQNDYVIFTGGSGYIEFEEFSSLQLKRLKGQILILPWPKHLIPLKVAISSNIYLTVSKDGNYCYVGSTYEREFETEEVDIDFASGKILPLLEDLLPPLKGIRPIGCKAGVRVTTAHRLPCLQKISDKGIILTGLGSKGLLYHALMAKKLVQMILHL